MKYFIIAIILCSSVSSHSQPASGPQELVNLTQQWQRARLQATAPIDKKYLDALTALKTTLTKKGDLHGALAVEAQIKSFNMNATPSTEPKEETGLPNTKEALEQFLVGTVWTVTTTQTGFVAKMDFTSIGIAMFDQEFKWQALDRRSIKLDYYTLQFSEDMATFTCTWGKSGERKGVLKSRKTSK